MKEDAKVAKPIIHHDRIKLKLLRQFVTCQVNKIHPSNKGTFVFLINNGNIYNHASVAPNQYVIGSLLLKPPLVACISE